MKLSNIRTVALAIPRANFHSIAFSERGGAGNSTGGLVFHCPFDDEASITTPAVGPAGAVSPRQFIEGKVGNASQHNTEPNSPFVMDELKIWNYAKQDFDL